MSRAVRSLLIGVGLLSLVGCRETIAAESKADSKPSPGQVTFTQDIAPLMFKHCAGCHRPGEVAPFPLLSYENAKKRGRLMATVTHDRQMPPWKGHADHGPFIGERRLSDDQIALIEKWVATGMAEGDAKDLPPAPQFTEGWKLGTPDIVLTMPEAYEIPAEGADIYRNFVLPLKLPDGKFIRAVEYRPSNRLVVHHAVFSADVTDKSRKADADDPQPGFQGNLAAAGRLLPGCLSVWVPGRDALPLPDGFSFPWVPGADLIMQLHLHPSGKPETESSSIGIHLTDKAPERTMVDLIMIDKKIDIPPGERSFKTRTEYTLPTDMEVYGIFPHMHLIGREIKITAMSPEGSPLPLLWIEDWDFNWQSYYQFVRPTRLTAGTKIVLEGVHDNSADNIRNPFQPPRRITWGEQTNNEMTVAFIQLIPVDEAQFAQLPGGQRKGLTAGIAGPKMIAAKTNGLNAAELVKKHDLNGDGVLNVEEMVKASGRAKDDVEKQAVRFDVDKDGALNATELQAALRALGQ